jgi:hypothetical protein
LLAVPPIEVNETREKNEPGGGNLLTYWQMNQWVSQIYQWTLLHPAQTVVLGLAGTLVTLLGFFWKPVCSFISFCGAGISRTLRSGLPEPRPHLCFVAIPSRCFLLVIERDDKQPNAQIRTHWNVKNASRSGIPARLLRATLVKPRVRDSPLTREYVSIFAPVDSIPPGETELVYIHVDFFLPPQKFNKPLKVQISVTDQLTNKHKLPEITLQPLVGVPAK